MHPATHDEKGHGLRRSISSLRHNLFPFQSPPICSSCFPLFSSRPASFLNELACAPPETLPLNRTHILFDRVLRRLPNEVFLSSLTSPLSLPFQRHILLVEKLRSFASGFPFSRDTIQDPYRLRPVPLPPLASPVRPRSLSPSFEPARPACCPP